MSLDITVADIPVDLDAMKGRLDEAFTALWQEWRNVGFNAPTPRALSRMDEALFESRREVYWVAAAWRRELARLRADADPMSTALSEANATIRNLAPCPDLDCHHGAQFHSPDGCTVCRCPLTPGEVHTASTLKLPPAADTPPAVGGVIPSPSPRNGHVGWAGHHPEAAA